MSSVEDIVRAHLRDGVRVLVKQPARWLYFQVKWRAKSLLTSGFRFLLKHPPRPDLWARAAIRSGWLLGAGMGQAVRLWASQDGQRDLVGEPRQWDDTTRCRYVDHLLNRWLGKSELTDGRFAEIDQEKHLELMDWLLGAMDHAREKGLFKDHEGLEAFCSSRHIKTTVGLRKVPGEAAKSWAEINKDYLLVPKYLAALQGAFEDYKRHVETYAGFDLHERQRARAMVKQFQDSFGSLPNKRMLAATGIPHHALYPLYACARVVTTRAKDYKVLRKDATRQEAWSRKTEDTLSGLNNQAKSSDSVLIGWAKTRLKKEPVYLPEALLQKTHKLVLGGTGSGKTVHLTNLLMSHLKLDPGRGMNACVLDLHGDLTEAVLKGIWYANPSAAATPVKARQFLEKASEHLVLLDFGREDFLPGINLLEREPHLSPQQQALALLEVFMSVFPGMRGAERMTQPVLMGLIALIAAGSYTLLEVPTFFQNRRFRELVIRESGDSGVRDYFEGPFEEDWKHGQGFVSRLTPLLHLPVFRRVFGQQKSTFNFLDAMNAPRLVVFHLPKAKLGSAQDVICSLLFNKFLHAAFARDGMPESKRFPYHLYADEFQNYARLGRIETLLTESRKFQLYLTLSFQNPKQEGLSENLAQIIHENTQVQSIFSFKGGYADVLARYLGQNKEETQQILGKLRTLSTGSFFLSAKGHRALEVEGINIRAEMDYHFTNQVLGKAFKDEADYHRALHASVIQRWTRSGAEVEQEISLRKTAINAMEMATASATAGGQGTTAEKERPALERHGRDEDRIDFSQIF